MKRDDDCLLAATQQPNSSGSSDKKMMSDNEEVMMDAASATDLSQPIFIAAQAQPANPFEQALIQDEKAEHIAPPDAPVDRLRRMVNLALAIAMIIFFAPVFLLVSLAIAVSDPGSVLYRQKRVGKNGRKFDCLKFRTMRVDAEQRLEKLLSQDPERQREWEENRKLEDDPRVTPIGKLLRLSSLDELPQLFNVITGDINLVGPRPIIEDELPCYGRYLRYYLSVRPGLTGMWQISGRSTTTYRRRVAADVLYIRRRCLALDIYILLATVPAVLFARGAA